MSLLSGQEERDSDRTRATLGSVAGAFVNYAFALLVGRPFLERYDLLSMGLNHDALDARTTPVPVRVDSPHGRFKQQETKPRCHGAFLGRPKAMWRLVSKPFFGMMSVSRCWRQRAQIGEKRTFQSRTPTAFT
jgi:hypothetical protein